MTCIIRPNGTNNLQINDKYIHGRLHQDCILMTFRASLESDVVQCIDRIDGFH